VGGDFRHQTEMQKFTNQNTEIPGQKWLAVAGPRVTDASVIMPH